jgi:hypothetical protein
MKTSDLTGFALDWAVAQCEGVAVDYVDDGINRCLLMSMGGRFNPSTNWAQGGSIIERESITIERNVKLKGCAVIGFHDWHATHPKNYGGLIRHSGGGPTPLIAAMRCYVASKLGDEIDIPTELMEGKQ